MNECFRVLQPGGIFVTFSLHARDEIEKYFVSNPGWKCTLFNVKSTRWDENQNRRRAVSHTMAICLKDPIDDSSLQELPKFPSILNDGELEALKGKADEVKLFPC